MPLNSVNITAWLNDIGSQDEVFDIAPGNELFVWLYEDLRRVARSQFRKEHPGHTLSATALTHEAWFRMNDQNRTQWTNRSHFLAVASTVMRRILLHHARAKRAEMRDAALVSLTQAEHVPEPGLAPDALSVHEALLILEGIDPRAARVVELKFFGGMENAEIADALLISLATVKREWSFAKAWLAREVGRSST